MEEYEKLLEKAIKGIACCILDEHDLPDFPYYDDTREDMALTRDGVPVALLGDVYKLLRITEETHRKILYKDS